MTPPLDLDAIRVRVAAATPGPWRFDAPGPPVPDQVYVETAENDMVATVETFAGPRRSTADAAFIAAARTDVPALCDALDAARATIAAQARANERLENEASSLRAMTARAGAEITEQSKEIQRLKSRVLEAQSDQLNAMVAVSAAVSTEARAKAVDATLAAQAAEVERLRGEAARAWSASADAQCEAARAYSIAAEMLAHPPDVAAARDDARALAADALRYGLEECERLRGEVDRFRGITEARGRSIARMADDRDALRDEVARLRAAVEGRTERIRIAALLRQRSNQAGGRHAGAICGGDVIAEAFERGTAEALLAVALELEAETCAEDERAGVKGDDDR